MRWHTKCRTPFQKQARKALRAAIRGLDVAKGIDLSKLNAIDAFEAKQDMDELRRVVDAFYGAHTDRELKAAMHLALSLLEDKESAVH
jgi:hypothetical protein